MKKRIPLTRKSLKRVLIDFMGDLEATSEHFNIDYEKLKKLLANGWGRDILQTTEEIKCDIAERKLLMLVKNGDFRAIQFFLQSKAKHRGYDLKQEVKKDQKIVLSLPRELEDKLK